MPLAPDHATLSVLTDVQRAKNRTFLKGMRRYRLRRGRVRFVRDVLVKIRSMLVTRAVQSECCNERCSVHWADRAVERISMDFVADLQTFQQRMLRHHAHDRGLWVLEPARPIDPDD